MTSKRNGAKHMKASKRNIKNAIARAEVRKAGPPAVSKYAAKVRQDVIRQPG